MSLSLTNPTTTIWMCYLFALRTLTFAICSQLCFNRIYSSMLFVYITDIDVCDSFSYVLIISQNMCFASAHSSGMMNVDILVGLISFQVCMEGHKNGVHNLIWPSLFLSQPFCGKSQNHYFTARFVYITDITDWDSIRWVLLCFTLIKVCFALEDDLQI